MELWENLVTRKDAWDILEELPENAYFTERGSVHISEIIAGDGIVPLRRFFQDTPNIIAYFTVKDKSESSNSNSSVTLSKELKTTCFKLLPSQFEVRTNCIAITAPQEFILEDLDVTFRYIAYLKAKPSDPSMAHLVNAILNGTSGVEQKIQAWLNEGSHYISATNADDQSLLHIAAQESNYQVVKWLVDRKADVGFPDKAGWTPIFCALNATDLKSAHYIAQNGGLQKIIFTSNGSNPLHYLARTLPSNTSETERFMYLLNKCIDTYGSASCQPNLSNETPLHRAALAGNILLVKRLLELVHSISFDPNLKNKFILLLSSSFNI